MSLEKQLELNTEALALNIDAINRNTAATDRLADLMEKFKPQPCTKKTRAKTKLMKDICTAEEGFANIEKVVNAINEIDEKVVDKGAKKEAIDEVVSGHNKAAQELLNSLKTDMPEAKEYIRQKAKTKAEEPITGVDMDELGTLIGGAAMEIIARRTEEPKAEEPKAEEPKAEEPKEVTLSDLREVAKVLLLKGPAAKADAKAAIAKIAGDDAKISTMDAKHYAEVYAALKAQEAKLEEV